MSDKYYVLDRKFFFEDITIWGEKPNRLDKITKLILEIEELDPKAVLIFSGAEINVVEIYGEFIQLLEPWLVAKEKFLYVFSSAPEYNKPLTAYQNVIWHLCPTYDIYNFNVITNYYMDNRPILTDPTKLFTCYNNTPRDYRTYMIDQLARADLLSNGIVTYRWYLEVLGIENNFDPLEDFLYYNGEPRLVDEEDFILHQGYIPNDLPKSYLEGLVDIVTETTVLPKEYYLSEKTNKPLMAQKPFLALSTQGYHAWLKQAKGIEPYTELFDYEFDMLPDYRHRVIGIITNLRHLAEEHKTPKDYKHLLQILKPKLEHNLNAYLTCVASAYKLLEDMPFEWIMKDPAFLTEEMLIRGNEDYNCEFYMLHSFIHTVALPYRNGTYNIPNISR